MLGFDVGGTKCAAILGKRRDASMPEIIEKSVFPTRDFRSPHSCIAKFVEEAERMLGNNKIDVASLRALGLSCGGPLDSKRGLVLSPPNLPGWDNLPIVDILRKHFSCPVFLQNFGFSVQCSSYYLPTVPAFILILACFCGSLPLMRRSIF